MKSHIRLFLLLFTFLFTGHAMASEGKRADCINLLNSKASEIEQEFNDIDTRNYSLIEKKFSPKNFGNNETKATSARNRFNDFFEKDLKKQLTSLKDTPDFYRSLADRTTSDESYYPKACKNPEKLENNYESDVQNYKNVWGVILLIAGQYVSSNQ